MRSVVTIAVMLSVMLLHACFGCCWHHPHSTSGAGACSSHCSSRPHVEHAGADHSHSHSHSQRSHGLPGGDESPVRHGQHCDEECQYLAGTSVELPWVGTLWQGTGDDAGDAVTLRAARHGERLGHQLFNGDAPPGYRRPLLCVWLI